MSEHEDWSETTERLMQYPLTTEEFKESDAYLTAFQEWTIKNYPEEYGNDWRHFSATDY